MFTRGEVVRITGAHAKKWLSKAPVTAVQQVGINAYDHGRKSLPQTFSSLLWNRKLCSTTPLFPIPTATQNKAFYTCQGWLRDAFSGFRGS